MKLLYLRLQNYRRHVLTELEFPDGVIAIVGRNGSGKSSLLEAIGFALFGTPAVRTGKDLIRHEDAAPGDSVAVQLRFELAGQAVELRRELRGKQLSPQAFLDIDGATLVAGGASSNEAASKAIVDLLGMDRDAFFSTVVAQQKELAGLAAKRPGERKRMLLSMLGIDAVDRAIKTARRRREEAMTRVESVRAVLDDGRDVAAELATSKKDLQTHSARLQTLEQAVAEAAQRATKASEALVDLTTRRDKHRDARHLEQMAKQALQAAQSRLERADAQCAQARSANEELEALGPSTLNDLKRTLEDAQQSNARRAQLLELQQRQQAAQTKLEALEIELLALTEPQLDPDALSELEALRANKSTLEAAIESVQARRHTAANLDPDTPCPTCERPLDSHHDALLRRLDDEQAALEGQLSALEGRMQPARSRVEAARRAQAEHAAWLQKTASIAGQIEVTKQEAQEVVDDIPAEVDTNQLRAAVDQEAKREARRQQLQADAGRLPAFMDELASAQQQQEEATKALAAAQAELGNWPDVEVAYQTAVAAKAEAEAALSAARANHDGARKEQLIASQRVDEQERRLQERERQQAILQDHEAALRQWTALAGPRSGGILPAFRDHLVQRIGPAISAHASHLLQAFTDGRYREMRLGADYEVSVADNGVFMPVERFSGGESDLVQLALRLAVSRLLAERSGAVDIRFLALDEVFGSLDSERLGLVLGALSKLGGLYSQVLLITHQSEVRDALDHALTVELQDGQSHVTLHQG